MFNNSNQLLRFTVFLLLAATAVFSHAAAVPGSAVSSATDAIDKFPLWYQDAAGVRVQACLDPNNSACIVLPDATFNPANPVVFPTNFPGEVFYFVADSDKLTTPGCAATGSTAAVAPGSAKYRAAVEASFVNGVPIPGDQITFARTKIVASGLCPNTTYTFTHPYGADQITTNNLGQVVANKKGGTIDVGCAGAPCDFSQALASRVFGGLIRWDPTTLPLPPAGYLGDAVLLHTVVGSPTGTNLFSITGPSGLVAQTNLFTVSGQVAGPLLASPTSTDFGGQNLSTKSTPTLITITNVDTGAAGITVSADTLTGTDAADFAIASDTCQGTTLAKDATCSIGVTFTPTVAARRNAQLTITHNGVRSPFVIPLSGTGITGGAPIASVSPLALNFATQRVRTASAAQTITISNDATAGAPLGTTKATITGTGSSQFTIDSDHCSGAFIDPGSSCTIAVKFAPTVPASFSASLDLTFNYSDTNGPVQQHVSLTGAGTGGVAAVSPAVDPNNGFPFWFEDENAIKLAPCLDAADTNCVVLADSFFNPALPLVFPTNFPTEFFYSVTDSEKLAMPGCPAIGWGPVAQGAFTRLALEGSFGLGQPAAGDQIAFGRIRIVVKPKALCPNTTYAFTHPYGTELVTTHADGSIPANKSGFTDDTGCLGAPCDFNQALTSRVAGGFLRWDPSVAPAAPAGYVGDALTLHPIIGSPYTAPGDAVPANLFRIADPTTGAVIAQTSLFTVSGKLAGPIPPIAGNDSASASSGSPVNVDVLANDTDPDGNVPLTVGQLNVAAHGTVAVNSDNTVAYTPNATFAGTDTFTYQAINSIGTLSNSATVTVNVTGPTTTTIAAPAVTSPANGSVTVTVSSSAGTPAGSVSLIIDGGAPVTQPLTNGASTFTLTNPSVGDHTLSATYAAQGSFAPSTATGTLTVNAPVIAATTTTITSPPVTSPANGVVTVAVSSANGTPTGSVSLSVDGAAAITQPLTNGASTFTLTSPSVGDHTLAASYAAQGNFGASTATGTLTVNPPLITATTTTITAPTVTSPANGVVTIAVSSANGTPTGSVSLSVDGATATTQPLTNGTSTFTLTGPSVGDHTLTASYAAQGNFGASTATGSITVNPAPPATTTTSISAAAVAWPANGSVVVSVGSTGGTPTGTVSLTVDGGTPINQPLTNGKSTFTLTNPAAGSHTLSATYAAQPGFTASSSSGSLTVNPAATSTTVSAPAITAGANGSVTVTVSSIGGTPTGSVSLSVDSGAPTSLTLTAGKATFTVTNPTAGPHTLSATYAAQGNFAASSGSGTLTVNQPVAIITATTVTASTVTFPANASISVAVSSTAGVPTGSVSLSVDSGAPLTAVLNAGVATFALNSPAVGTHNLVATYAPQGGFAGSSGNGTLTVNPAPLTPTATTVAAAAITSPANGSVIVTVSSAAGTPTGSVTLSVDGAAPVSALLAGGTATFTVTSPAVGPHTLAASYASQNGFAASTAGGTLTVNPPATAPTVTITSKPAAITNSASPAFSFTSNAAGATFRCSLSTGADAYAACTSPKTYTAMASGLYTFKVIATSGTLSSTPATYSFRIDTVVPTTTVPTKTLLAPNTLTASTVPVRMAWTGADSGSGIGHYEMQLSHAAGAFAAVTLSSPTATTATVFMSPGNNQVRVRAVDNAGNAGAWATTAVFNVGVPSETSPVYTGTWTTSTLTGAFGGSVKFATAAGATAKLTFSGSSVAFVTTKGPNRGIAQIFIDGATTPTATVDLYAATQSVRQLVFATNGLSTTTTHTITVRVTGTKNAASTSTRVDVDGYVNLK